MPELHAGDRGKLVTIHLVLDDILPVLIPVYLINFALELAGFHTLTDSGAVAQILADCRAEDRHDRDHAQDDHKHPDTLVGD